MRSIIIRGARHHNLRDFDLEIPRNRLVVITGLSGSGNRRWPLTPSTPRGSAATSNPFPATRGSSWSNSKSLMWIQSKDFHRPFQ